MENQFIIDHQPHDFPFEYDLIGGDFTIKIKNTEETLTFEKMNFQNAKTISDFLMIAWKIE